MNSIKLFLSTTLLLLSSANVLASSQPPIKLDFDPSDFALDKMQLPADASNAPRTLNRVDSRFDGTIPTRDYVRELAPQASKVTVSGRVKKYANLLTGGGSGLNLLQNADGIEVKFWQRNAASAIYSATTNDQGDYSIELSNGFWQGEACGSSQGYNPNAWQVNVQNNQLVNLQQVVYSRPKITRQSLDLVLQGSNIQQFGSSTFIKSAGDEIRINGSGFGCNGALVFEFQNAVDQCGKPQNLEYGHAVIKVDNFISRSDTQLVLTMPSLRDAVASKSSVSQRIAKMYYQKGAIRSNAIVVAEFVQDPLVTSVCDGSLIATVKGEELEASTGFTQELVTLFESVAPVEGAGAGINAGTGTPFFSQVPSLIVKDVLTIESIGKPRALNLTVDVDNINRQLGR